MRDVVICIVWYRIWLEMQFVIGDHKVRISGGVRADGKAYVCVEDDGPGIPEQERARIFEAFARLDDSRTRASPGYGFGFINRESYCLLVWW